MRQLLTTGCEEAWGVEASDFDRDASMSYPAAGTLRVFVAAVCTAYAFVVVSTHRARRHRGRPCGHTRCRLARRRTRRSRPDDDTRGLPPPCIRGRRPHWSRRPRTRQRRSRRCHLHRISPAALDRPGARARSAGPPGRQCGGSAAAHRFGPARRFVPRLVSSGRPRSPPARPRSSSPLAPDLRPGLSPHVADVCAAIGRLRRIRVCPARAPRLRRAMQ